MNFTVVVLAIVVIILLYVVYQYFTTKKSTLAKQVALLTANPAISITSANPRSYRYTYTLWLYVNTWDNTNYKPVFYRNYGGGIAGTGTAPSPISTLNTGLTPITSIMLYLDKTTPTLYLQLPEQTTNASPDTQQPYIITPNFPLQTWTYVAISIDSNFIDFYVNGKLVKSVQTQYTPTMPSDATNQIYMGSGWDGMVSTFTYQNGPISPQDAWNAYLGGSGVTSGSTSYNVNVDLLKNSQVQSTFTLF